MSHLGDRVSALIDGELTGAELDRANAHLASCERCRSEAASLRDLKRELRALGDAPAGPPLDTEAATVRRLIAAAGPGGPMAPRRRSSSPPSGGPRPAKRRDRRQRRARPRAYAVVGVVGIAVVSLGAAAFTVGGGTGEPEPKVTPNMQMYAVEHAITTGDVPLPQQSEGSIATSQP
jgi:anti-sigma factor RsiW